MPHPPRSQWPKRPQSDHGDRCEIDVDIQEGVCELRVGFSTMGLGYAEVMRLISQLTIVRDLLEPPAPVGRTYTPKLGNH